MRAKIRKVHNIFGECWCVEVGNYLAYFDDFHVALKQMNKFLKRAYKESSAFSMARTISVPSLAIPDRDFVRKMFKAKCKGITMKQYGYLKGIHERQQRE